MGKNSNISWTHHTFNPWHGCAKVSEGCKLCYAEKQDNRWASTSEATDGKAIRNTHWGASAPRKMMSEAYWKQLEKWNRDVPEGEPAQRVFVASMADVFESRPDLIQPRERLFSAISDYKRLNFLLLTKRPENIIPLTNWSVTHPPRSNTWIGCTAENQKNLERRALHMQMMLSTITGTFGGKSTGPITFMSAEPLLGRLDLTKIEWRPDWIIVGGESGPGARAMSMEWVHSIYQQCEDLGISFFFKQTGAVLAKKWRYQDKAGADPGEWPAYLPSPIMSQNFPRL